MGGGKGKSKIPVKDYLLSIDYGICLGELDSINEIRVKEEVIWCGRMTAPGTIRVDLPDLFGGSLAEGGVRGDIDIYFGSASQVQTSATALQYGLTPETMPGYRGIAHAMFRDGNAGFKWSTNNPYYPSTWINATRIPKQLSTDFAVIYPHGRDYDDEASVTSPNSTITSWDLEALGVTGADVDASLVRFAYSLAGFFELTTGGPASGVVQLEVHYYNTADSEIPPADFLGGSVSGNGTCDIDKMLPVGTRRMTIRPQVLASMPIFTRTTISSGGKVEFPSNGPSWCGADGSKESQPQANPAHMIYEAMTREDLGMAAAPSAFDIPSFMAAAQIFYDEGMGLTIAWEQVMEVERYVGEILDHVAATLFIHPKTGLWTLYPIRGGYVVNDLPLLDPTNTTLENPQRKGLGETVNEVVIEWTNPDSEETETIVFQDAANIAAQGGIVSTTRNFYGVRYPELANVLGQRELRAVGYPLFGAEAYIDRTVAGDVFPGAVVRLTWPEHGLTNLPCRVGAVDYGKPGDSKVKLSLTEDVYGLETSSYTTVQRTGWEDPAQPPTPMDHVEVITSPLALYLRSGVPLDNISDGDYPIVPVAVLAARDAGGPVESFDLVGDGVLPNGDPTKVVLADLSPTSTDTLTTGIGITSEITWPASEVARFIDYGSPEPGTFLMIGSGDAGSEIVMLDKYDADADTWLVSRGMFDTVPRPWDAGVRVWFLGDFMDPVDPSQQSSGAEITYHLLPLSEGGKLTLEEATPVLFTPSDRPYCPIRPANVQFSFTGGDVQEVGDPPRLLANGNAEFNAGTGPADWTYEWVSVSEYDYFYDIGPQDGTRFFEFGGTVGHPAFMEQELMIPRGMDGYVSAGEVSHRFNFWITATGPAVGDDELWIEVDYFDDSATLIQSYVSDHYTASAQGVWQRVRIGHTIPVGARTYVFRVRAENVSGSSTGIYADNITVRFVKDRYPLWVFTAAEIPDTMDFTWANRNRLTEDSVAPRWEDASTTPEDGQTTLIRVRERFSRAVELEVSGITGTSYSLDLSTLTAYRLYDVEVLSERDGFESIQWFTQPIELVRAGYGYNYGYDYGENDGG